MAWASLVRRSIEAWGPSRRPESAEVEKYLRERTDLDEFLDKTSSTLMFWFFQRREVFLSQQTMTKWEGDRLDDYVVFPVFPGFVTRDKCFFISHFWRQEDHPDPNGEDLRLHQTSLTPASWSYIWVDWSCLPQHPRSDIEEAYFRRALTTIPAIITNCRFTWFYPNFQPRLWILFEVAQYFLTTLAFRNPPDHVLPQDMRPFKRHIDEMEQDGVQSVLARYGYMASLDRDREYLTSWLDLIILLKRINLDVFGVRALCDNMALYPWMGGMTVSTANVTIELRRWEGVLVVGQNTYTFKPVPE
ncbi:hypothetical protein CMUS01_12650 [Colletotrichum musicola]|uniref:Heterokaryon incompatibility domain-containing protein n=1 Tax=Colletotrichum musicola TaxID=2175873 RepID=A0A8H6JKS2_9PEZI|nr:hypothetical protein CMUS01_12650 [Colletotrichum musicola]